MDSYGKLGLIYISAHELYLNEIQMWDLFLQENNKLLCGKFEMDFIELTFCTLSFEIVLCTVIFLIEIVKKSIFFLVSVFSVHW